MQFRMTIFIAVLFLIPVCSFGLENQFELNGFQIHQYRSAIEGALGKPIKTGETEQFEWEAYGFDKKSYMIFQFYKKHAHLIYSIQITGKESTMLPFNGLTLGADKSKITEILGEPDLVRDISHMNLKYYFYENRNFSAEVSEEGKLYSIKISFYPELYGKVESSNNYWIRFKEHVANRDFANLSVFFRPDAEIFYNGSARSIDSSFAKFFTNTSTVFYKALLSDTGSVYEELKNDTSERKIRILEKVGVGFVHKFYKGKVLKEIVFLPYAGQYRIYEIAFK